MPLFSKTWSSVVSVMHSQISQPASDGFSSPSGWLIHSFVPDAQWPTQFNETRAGYTFLRETFGDGSAAKICVSGDSAGATLILSMLLQPGHLEQDPQFQALHKPGLAVLMSPWTHLVSSLNQNTPSDYLDRESLHLYAKQYAGKSTTTDEVISPGLSTGRWKQAAPVNGYRVVFGGEEVFAPGIHEMVKNMRNSGAVVKEHEHQNGIHAWPVVNLFLGRSRKERLSGLDMMTEYILASSMASKVAKV